MSNPANVTVPLLIGAKPRIALPTVDFPDPDSPTRPTVSRGAIVKLTESTARNEVDPCPRSNSTVRSCTCSNWRLELDVGRFSLLTWIALGVSSDSRQPIVRPCRLEISVALPRLLPAAKERGYAQCVCGMFAR